MHTFDAVKKAIHPEIAKVGPLPPLLGPMVDLFSKAHLYYRSFRLGHTFQQAAAEPEKGNAAAYGAALHLAADYTSLEYVLKVALAAKCAEDILREYRHVSDITLNFWDAVQCQYPMYQPIAWDEHKIETNRFLAPSYYLSKLIQLAQLTSQIHKVASRLAPLIWQTFKLSMCLSDAYLVLNGDQQARFESFTELVSEWDVYQNLLEDDKKRLVEAMKNGSDVADRILKHLQVPETSASLIKKMEQKLEKQTPVPMEEFIDDIYEVAKDALDPLYIKGKITPMHLDFSEGAAAPPALAPGKFPPWGGQKTIAVPAAKKEEVRHWTAEASTLLFENTALGPAYKSLQNLAGKAKSLFFPFNVNGRNPFA